MILFSLCFNLLISAKQGAAPNYFIPAAWASMLALALKMERANSRLILAGLVVCSLLQVAGIARSLSGPSVYYDFRYMDSAHRVLAES